MHEHMLSTLQLWQEWKTQYSGNLVSYPFQSYSKPKIKQKSTNSKPIQGPNVHGKIRIC